MRKMRILLGAFFFMFVFSFFGIEADASESVNIGTPGQVSTLTGPDIFLYNDAFYYYDTKEQGPDSYYISDTAKGLIITYNHRMPVGTWNGGDSIYVPSQYDSIRFLGYGTINLSTNFDAPYTSTESSVASTVTDIYINVNGQKYYCYFTIDDDREIQFFYDFTLDIPYNGYRVWNGSMSLGVEVLYNMYSNIYREASVGTYTTITPSVQITYGVASLGSFATKLYFYDSQNLSESDLNDQTDTLTNGFDSSASNETSTLFADNASSYEQAESSIFTSATTNLDSFEFYDVASDSSVLTGLSFVSATMTSIFGAMGGLSGGAGIVLSVLFSVMLVSIVIGLYRYFVSSGKAKSSGARKGGKT